MTDGNPAMTTPAGWDAVYGLYGDPRPYMRFDGTVSPLWESRLQSVAMPSPLELLWDPRPARSVRVNVAIVEEVERVFQLLEQGGLWQKFRTFDGGYEWRRQRKSASAISLHSFGAALDFDAATNEQGMPGDMDPAIVQCFEACGWTWGGRFGGSRMDPMHFQFARGV